MNNYADMLLPVTCLYGALHRRSNGRYYSTNLRVDHAAHLSNSAFGNLDSSLVARCSVAGESRHLPHLLCSGLTFVSTSSKRYNWSTLRHHHHYNLMLQSAVVLVAADL